MKTDAVMCMALTRQSPSRTPLAFTSRSVSRVMFTSSIRSCVCMTMCFVCDFIGGAQNTGAPHHGAEWRSGRVPKIGSSGQIGRRIEQLPRLLRGNRVDGVELERLIPVERELHRSVENPRAV